MLRRNVGLASLNVTVAGGKKLLVLTAHLFVPADQDALLNMYIEHDAEFGGLTPYYGVVWPSALALSLHVQSEVSGRGVDVVELGCRCGFVGIAAALTCAPRSVAARCSTHHLLRSF